MKKFVENIAFDDSVVVGRKSTSVPIMEDCCWKGRNGLGVLWEVYNGDAKEVLGKFEAERFKCVITSPPYYWQRDYDVVGQIGKESKVEGYVNAIADIMDVVRVVLDKDGVLFLNLGDTYYSAKGKPKGNDPKNRARRFGLRAVDASGLGFPRKSILGMPWRVALEMISRGWILRSPIIWRRDGAIPEPTAKDRPWRTYEMVFMFSKTPKYFFARNNLGEMEDVWNISARPKSSNGLHSAAFPEQLVQRCLDIGCPPKGAVLDPFAGSGTVLRVALRSGRPAVGIDLCERYCRYIADSLKRL